MASNSNRPRDDRLVIGIAGRIGSGKTSVGKYLNSAHGYQYVRYSQVLSDWRASDPESKAHLQEVGWEVMAGGMQEELNRRLIAQIMPDADVAVDGLRHPTDFRCLNTSFSSSFHLLFLESSLTTRWERLRSRSKYATLESFKAADSHAVERQIEALRVNAALVIPNEGSPSFRRAGIYLGRIRDQKECLPIALPHPRKALCLSEGAWRACLQLPAIELPASRTSIVTSRY
jgi:cytidylate kinase